MKTSRMAYQPGNSDVEDARRYRVAQATELLLRFREAEGREARDVDDLAAWVARSDHERPIEPRPGLCG